MKEGQPTQAALGFAKTCGVEFSELTEKAGKLHFSKRQPGKATADLLAEIFEETLKSMDELVPKRMRWGSSNETFVRPVQWLVAMLGKDIVPLRRFGLEAGRITYGHRFHAPAAVSLATPADYVPALLKAKVWSDVASRKAEIRRQIEAEAAKLGGTARISEDLLDEVTALVEWPVVISGRIEERFLELPPEVIVATVETNQRYFTVFDKAGKLLPCFITIANIESNDVAQVIQGNERVVRPRLSDALFFWRQDLKASLAEHAAKLSTVTFQKDLGSTAEKITRVAKLAVEIADQLGAHPGAVDRIARLMKGDLATRMVYEFPELQGLMGGYYARRGGEPEAIATAIAEHYRPTHAGGPIPSTTEGRIVALADKVDTLAGIFAVGLKPTASKDPFALRRTALGVLRILLEAKLPLNLRSLLQGALNAQPTGKRNAEMLGELLGFVQERLRAFLVGSEIDGRAVTSEMFEAVASLGITQPLDFSERLHAIHAFWSLTAAQSLAAAHKRVRNILKQAEGSSGDVDPARFESDAERSLHAALEALDVERVGADYTARLAQLAQLKSPVDAFFDGVMVMADDPAVRANRIALLRRLDSVCREVADISCLPG